MKTNALRKGYIKSRSPRVSRKRYLLAAMLCASIIAFTSAFAQVNPLQVAVRRWYNALNGVKFQVGLQPMAVVFDGSNIWVTHHVAAPNVLQKVNPSTGQVIGTFFVGNGPFNMTFDGNNGIWVANAIDNTVMKLRADNGAVVFTRPVNPACLNPRGLEFDGEKIWVACSDSNSLVKLQLSDGAFLGSCAPGGTQPHKLAFDGTFIWVANLNSGTVTKLASDCTIEAGFPAPAGPNPTGMAFDGTNMWIANFVGGGGVTVLDSSGTPVPGSPFSAGSFSNEITFDGANIWVTNAVGDTVTKFGASTFTVLGTFPVGHTPQGIAFDGTYIWVANFADTQISKL